MNEVIAPAGPLKINFTELNVRQAGKPHFIRLGDGVVKRLERQLIDRPPVTGSERFDLLLGSIVGRDPCTIAVEDFEPTAKLEERIGVRTPRPGSPQRIVGFYRSHREADFELNPADRGLFEPVFPRLRGLPCWLAAIVSGRLTMRLPPPHRERGNFFFKQPDSSPIRLSTTDGK